LNSYAKFSSGCHALRSACSLQPNLCPQPLRGRCYTPPPAGTHLPKPLQLPSEPSVAPGL